MTGTVKEILQYYENITYGSLRTQYLVIGTVKLVPGTVKDALNKHKHRRKNIERYDKYYN